VNLPVNDLNDMLANHPFFAGMPTACIERAGALARVVDHAPGAWIARTGNVADAFHAVVDGRAAVELTAAGTDPLVIATLQAGDVIGWSWFVSPYRWRFDVLALDEVRTLSVDAAALRAACESDHDLGYRIAHRLTGVIAARLESTRHQLVDVYGRPH
jgi:CRP/FNR family cyclic AMP-dependent transcriptional regulator